MKRLDFECFGGIRLAADAFGSEQDPAVLLIPSAGQTREYWHGSAQALADAGRYAICIDLRGHGDSDRPGEAVYSLDAHVADLKAILRALPTRAAIVAAGFGAIIALVAVGESAPHLVSGLALVDATIWFHPSMTDRLKVALALRTAKFPSPAAVLEAVATVYPDEPPPAGGVRLLHAFTQGENGLYAWRGDPRALMGIELLEKEDRLQAAASRIAAPVTLIRGSRNDSITAEATERLRAMIPGAETVEIEGAGHYAAIDREEVFNALLLDFLERRAPRQPLAYRGGAEPRLLRDALGCFSTGVTIITTIGADGEPVGFTANSFTSVSLDPPLILVSVGRSSSSLGAMTGAERFAVNVLHIGQQPLGDRFARRDGPRFEGIDWQVRTEGGCPIIAQSLASFDCRKYAVHEGGDHLIFIGEVTHAWFEPHRDPLLFFRGKYRRLHFA